MISEIMDKRDVFFAELVAFEAKYHFIPAVYENDARVVNALADYKARGSWRARPAVVRMVAKAERKIRVR